jgi:hypothetical protein
MRLGTPAGDSRTERVGEVSAIARTERDLENYLSAMFAGVVGA